ncbi:hypothetical protein H4C80_14685 [Pseudomonas juntendi]|uniref:Uncharacterized protein n=1 Tax=Pseudomonas juntendi TaxID=2666183 RepID=A0A7W2KH06_9PSED|nr:hypothetical protein [Pseudomonas juntendi]MBA6098371.1 hypothetical protein [Pseudomonas juntendi]
MKDNVIDVAGGTFVVAAVSYSTGTAYYNSYFRELNANPDLFSVSVERVFFEGGRQLLDLAFTPLVVFACCVVLLAVINMVLEAFGITILRKVFDYLKMSSLYAGLKEFWWVFGFIAISYLTFIAFDRGVEAGKYTADNKNCTRVYVEGDEQSWSGCIIYKTESEAWVLTAESNQRVLVNIPADKYKSIRVY